MAQVVRRYTRERLERAATESTSAVDMLGRLGQPLAAGPLRYLRRRLAHYAIDTTHFVEEALPRRPRQRYTREMLAEAAAHADSLAGVMENLGVVPYDSAYRHIAKRLEHFGIDTSHFGAALNEADLRGAVAESSSVAGTMRALGLHPSGAARSRVKHAIQTLGVPTTHFTGQGHCRGRPARNRRTADDVLRKLPEGAPRTRRLVLHRAMQEKGVAYECATCGTGDQWRGKRLVLEMDHVNGDRGDNRLGNLRYLCPSCHSQTPTFARPLKRHPTPQGTDESQ
ncbi:HNH endonuclease [Streptomyces ovatisporus]|uniref:HNH endonuclease n=1 Tax=Streptomyces ovatisporus TaxID=1128682 RepID=A0ABV9AGQ1_9ACTN